MRISLLLLAQFLSGASLAIANDEAVIVVQAEHSNGQMLTLTKFRAEGLQMDTVATAISDDGRFALHIIADTNTYYSLILGSRHYLGQLYLCPNDSIVIHYDTFTGPNIIFDRIGANKLSADSSRYWLHNDDPFYHHLGYDDWPTIQSYLHSIQAGLDSVSKAISFRYPEHPYLHKSLHEHGIEKYWYGTFNYIGMHYWDTADKDLVKDLKSLDILDSIPWSMPQIYHNSELWNIIGTWLNASMLRRPASSKSNTKDYIETLFQVVHDLPECVRGQALLNAMPYASGSDPTISYPIVERYYTEYLSTSKDTTYFTTLRQKLATLRAKLPGNIAPAFTLPDASNNMISLSQFRGKLIYLDFWGSWCMPCLKELPALQALEEKFKNDTSVVFISIALEGGSQVFEWKKTLEYRELKGVQLLAIDQFGNPVAKMYGIQSVPTFMLIAPDGTFINAAAPRPSDPAAEQAIRNALKKLANP